MPALSLSALPLSILSSGRMSPYHPWIDTAQRPHHPGPYRTAGRRRGSLAQLQAQAQTQQRAEDEALWEVMMRPA